MKSLVILLMVGLFNGGGADTMKGSKKQYICWVSASKECGTYGWSVKKSVAKDAAEKLCKKHCKKNCYLEYCKKR